MGDLLSKPSLPADWQAYYLTQAQACRDKRLKNFFNAGLVDPGTPLKEVPFVAMDFETTGLNAQAHSIVSIGLVPFTLARIYCRKSSHFLVKPRQDLSSKSVTIHGITHSDVLSAPDLDEVLQEVLSRLAKQVVVVHYRHIERDFLNQAVMTRIQEPLLFPVIDTMSLEERILQKQRSLFSRLLGRRPSLSLRLPDARQRYGLPRYHLHHAMTDALATAELLQAQVAHFYDQNMPISRLWY